MDQLHALLIEMARDLKELREEVRHLREVQPAPKRDKSNHRLLSLREAARRLGIDRNSTLNHLIRDRKIKVTKVNGKQKIPADEVERLVRDGYDTRTSL